MSRMSTGGAKKGAPKHQNATAWKPDRNIKKKDKELGGKQHPYPAITGVCARCKEKIEWRRKYGKYKPLTEPAKCHQCGKRTVRQAYHALCTACAKERSVCAKCCHPSEHIIGRDAEKEEIERKQLEQAIGSLREREKRTLLRAMEKGCTVSRPKTKELPSADEDDNPDSESEDDIGSDISGSESENVNSTKL